MRVQKRNGDSEEVSFDKVLKRVKLLSSDLAVNAYELAQKVCSRIYDGVKTSELDELAAHMCSSMMIDHPDYGKLASRIIISNHHKNTSPSFSETIQLLYDNVDIHNQPNPLVSEELYTVVMKNKEKLNSYINYERDYEFDYFGFKTLEKAYLMRVRGKVTERPQHMLMRVALGIHGTDVKDALQTYDMMSQKMFTHATPTLFNAGTPRPQNSSCFLVAMQDDSVEGIFDTLKDCALISKNAGGIGVHIHNIRARNSLIRGTNGTSTGIVPMLRVYNNTARYINQGGKRNGSIAVFLEPWHADVEMFLDMRKNHGNEEERARDLFYAMWIPDLFMRRVQENGMWSLMCPDMCKGLSDAYGEDFDRMYTSYENNGTFIKQVKAQELWFRILESQIETGTPYMLYKDAVNRKNNQANLGTIRSSNLCVAPETMVFTDCGYYPIQALCDRRVNVWNGKCFSSTVVHQTGHMQKLLTLHFSNGLKLRCTPYHKFYIDVGDKQQSIVVQARDMRVGALITRFDVPLLNISENGAYVLDNAYTQGVFAACGYYTWNGGMPALSLSNLWYGHLDHLEWMYLDDHQHVILPKSIKNKSFVPINSDLSSKLNWLAGFLDAAAIIQQDHIEVTSNNYDFLTDVVWMLQTLGVRNPRIVSRSKSQHALCVECCSMSHLVSLGFNPKRNDLETVVFNNMEQPILQHIRVERIEDNNEYADTYCFNEPKEHKGIFNGILTGQCTEIMEYSSPEECAVCNLASMCLPTFVDVSTQHFDHEKLHLAVKVVTKNLNKIIDRNYYPVAKARLSNLRHRPIGIGVQGLADTYALLRIPFDSDEARTLNRDIFETMYHASLEASMEISRRRAHIIQEQQSFDKSYLDANVNELDSAYIASNPKYPGSYTTFDGSPASKGVLQFDMWGVQPSSGRYDWHRLKQDIMEYGLRNSLLLAPMPTASTSQIMGFNEAFEPFTSNLYKRKTLAGEFILMNKYLMKDLISLNLWNNDMKNKLIIHEGSVQNIPEIPDNLKELYKTAWEIKQRVIIDQAAERGAYICQSQSMNLFMESPDFQKLTSMHFYAWERGLKTGMYYLRTKPKAKTQQFTMDPKLACSLKNKEACEMCSA